MKILILVAVLFVVIAIGTIFLALWLTRKIERAWDKRKKKKEKASTNVFDLIGEEKANFAESVLDSSKKLREATESEAKSVERQRRLLEEVREIIADRQMLKRTADRLPRKKGWVDRNKYTILLIIFGTYLVIMCSLFCKN